MSRIQKEKLEIYTDAALQIVSDSDVTAADDCDKKSPENRKKEADKPLYIKRI